MKIYDESGQLLTAAPDPAKGWLSTEQRVSVHHPEQPAVQEKSHVEVMPGTDDLRCRVVDVPYQPARPAWDEYETVQVYHPFTPEELAEKAKPTLEERVTAAEDALMELMLGGAANV